MSTYRDRKAESEAEASRRRAVPRSDGDLRPWTTIDEVIDRLLALSHGRDGVPVHMLYGSFDDDVRPYLLPSQVGRALAQMQRRDLVAIELSGRLTRSRNRRVTLRPTLLEKLPMYAPRKRRITGAIGGSYFHHDVVDRIGVVVFDECNHELDARLAARAMNKAYTLAKAGRDGSIDQAAKTFVAADEAWLEAENVAAGASAPPYAVEAVRRASAARDDAMAALRRAVTP